MNISLNHLHNSDSNNNNNNTNGNCNSSDCNKLFPVQKNVSVSKLWSSAKRLSTNNCNNNVGNNCNGIMRRREYNCNHNHYQRYRSGSSSDSAITLDSPTIDDEFKSSSSTPIDDCSNDRSDIVDSFNQLAYHLATMALEDETFYHSEKFNQMIPIIKLQCDINNGHHHQPSHHLDPFKCNNTLSTGPVNCDSFGFIKESAKSEEDEEREYLKDLIVYIINYRASKLWSIGCDNLKHLIREYGIPDELRPQVWMAFIRAKLGQQYDIDNLLGLANDINYSPGSLNESIIKQIDLDVTRTMPGNIMFSSSIGLAKLRRILIAYCIHVNPFVGYCQAMNFIAALLLLIFQGNEAQSLMGLICIIDHYFPPNYFDEQLTGARSDQLLLRDLFLERLDSEEDRALFSGSLFVQITNSLTLNWFLSLFHNAVPWPIRLQILDCFWIEGVKVLFRFSIALIELGREGLTSSLPSNYLNDLASGEIINSIKEKSRRCHDIHRLKRLAFRSVKIPKRKHLAARRSFYVKQIDIGLDDIVIIKSNSLSSRNHQANNQGNYVNHQHQPSSYGHQLMNYNSNTSSPVPSSSPDDEINCRNQFKYNSDQAKSNITSKRKWLRRENSGLLRGLTQSNNSNRSIESTIELALSSDNSSLVTAEENGTQDELIVTTFVSRPSVAIDNLDPNIDHNQSPEASYRRDKKMVIKLSRRKNHARLFGISNDSKRIYFYHETIKNPDNISQSYGNWINIVPIGYRVKSAFHDSSKGISLFVGYDGIVSRVDHNYVDQLDPSTCTTNEMNGGNQYDYNDDNLRIETISLDQQSHQSSTSPARRRNSKCTTQSAAYDPISGQLGIYMITPEASKLFILDTLTLDVYNCLYIDCSPLNHLSLSSPSTIFTSTLSKDPLMQQFETIYLHDSNGSTTIKYPIVQNTDLIVTIRSFPWSPSSSSTSLSSSPSTQSNDSNHFFSHWYQTISSTKSTSQLTNCSSESHQQDDCLHHLLVVLFKNCRLLCIQINCDHRITRKRSCSIDNFDCEKAIIVNVETQLDIINVTIFSPLNKLKTVTL